MSTDILSPEPRFGKLNVLVTKLQEFLSHVADEHEDEEVSLPQHLNGLVATNSIVPQQTDQTLKEETLPSCSNETKQLHETRQPPSARSRRKPLIVVRHTGQDESDCSSDSRSIASNDSSDLNFDFLPKGTVVVRPQPVEDDADEFRGPEFGSKTRSKQNRLIKQNFDYQVVSCTACGQQVNHFQKDSVYRHPALKVLICKSCFRYYMSDDISKDADGTDAQCRWCAEGGNLICCDYCTNAFCKKCVLRNFGRKELSVILDPDKKWHCYVCCPEPLVRLVLTCDSTLQNLQNGGSRRARLEPQRGKILDQKGQHHQTQDGQAFSLSSGLLQRTQRLIEMTMALNQSFVQFMEGCEEDSSDEEEDRTLKLRDYSNVPIDLQNAYDALQQAVETELRRCGQGDLRTLYPSSEPEQPASKVKEGETSTMGDDQEDERDIQPMDEESRCSLWVQQMPPQSSTDASMEGNSIFESDKSSSNDLEMISMKKSMPHDQSSSPSYSSSSSSSTLTPLVKPRPRGRGRPRKHPPKLQRAVEPSSHSSSSETGGCASESGCDSDFKDQQTTTKGVSPLNAARSFHVSPNFYLQTVSCTACPQQMNHFQWDAMYRHPALGVLICKSCYSYYMSDDISKDVDGTDEQCRWCAEGGNLICCDYCTNAFCKKCILRNFGRKALSVILDAGKKWHCYVCNPEALVGLVLACDATLESLHNYGTKRARLDPQRTDIFVQKGPFGHTQDFFVSVHLSERNQRLVEMTTALNESYMQFMQSFREVNFDDEEERTMKLKAYFHILVDLKKAHDALKNTVEAEIQRCPLKGP
ncbi:transcriptional regulator ATRX-like isoform X1 [Sardina pilchardus]|uniref:transcriptional regulator ATRX-like isoform X1 n=1 Tax=Sardina pilchardus TaxID=27697 RepID=UPI002E1105AF